MLSDQSGRTIAIVGFDGRKTRINTSFPIEGVIRAFRKQVDVEWAKRTSKLLINEPITLTGEFVRIDGGSRLLRYLTNWIFDNIAGKAVVEVRGHCDVGGQHLCDFRFVQKWGAGLFSAFGADSQALLIHCAQDAADRIVSTVVVSMRRR